MILGMADRSNGSSSCLATIKELYFYHSNIFIFLKFIVNMCKDSITVITYYMHLLQEQCNISRRSTDKQLYIDMTN